MQDARHRVNCDSVLLPHTRCASIDRRRPTRERASPSALRTTAFTSNTMEALPRKAASASCSRSLDPCRLLLPRHFRCEAIALERGPHQHCLPSTISIDQNICLPPIFPVINAVFLRDADRLGDILNRYACGFFLADLIVSTGRKRIDRIDMKRSCIESTLNIVEGRTRLQWLYIWMSRGERWFIYRRHEKQCNLYFVRSELYLLSGRDRSEWSW